MSTAGVAIQSRVRGFLPWLLLAVLAAASFVATRAIAARVGSSSNEPLAQSEQTPHDPRSVRDIDDSLDSGASRFETHFETWDLFIDPRSTPLAAWQLRVGRNPAVQGAPSPRVGFVGLEGGDHAAFRDPPIHDADRMADGVHAADGSIVIAQFSLDEAADLPMERFLAATLHVEVRGAERATAAPALLTAHLEAAASSGARTLPLTGPTAPALALVKRSSP